MLKLPVQTVNFDSPDRFVEIPAAFAVRNTCRFADTADGHKGHYDSGR